MCGIAGTYNSSIPRYRAPNVRTTATISAMADAIAHRGPDADGFLLDGPVALANRRLAIVDLSAAGRQPQFTSDGQIGIVYNGELYNFHALRSELIRRGHRFASGTDTEVIVHAYEEFGGDCVRHFNGMFAFAIWDRRADGRLVLARDRWGIKPLYYAQVGDTLVFGSEVKSFLHVPGFRVNLDLEAATEYLTFQNMLGDRTLFDGVRTLPAGSMMVVEGDRSPRVTRWWQPHFEATEDRGEAWYVTGVRDRFEEAVRRQLMGDVPVGSYLSGGMDSGSITAIAARQIPHLHTFTGGFPVAGLSGGEALSDERTAAEFMARTMGTEHYTVVVQPHDLPRLLPELVWHLEDLRVASSYHNYAAARLASRFVKVVLAGAGGDEIFAGYPWRYAHVAGTTSLDDFAARYADYWSILVPDAEKSGLFVGDLARAARGFRAAERVREVVSDLGNLARTDPLHLAMTFEARTYLQGLFIVEDRVSMAHSLESRVPFLDDDLVDFASAMPSNYKLRDGTGKRILRDAMRGLIPDEILVARKQGFAPPEDTWFRKDLAPYFRDLIDGSRARSRGLFNAASVQTILDDHVSGARNHKKVIWSLACLEQWQRTFIDGDRPVPSWSPNGRTGRSS
jgi:asparagine synthase (glutamine-hydrolysing)